MLTCGFLTIVHDSLWTAVLSWVVLLMACGWHGRREQRSSHLAPTAPAGQTVRPVLGGHRLVAKSLEGPRNYSLASSTGAVSNDKLACRQSNWP
jgi:hypothetical protein